MRTAALLALLALPACHHHTPPTSASSSPPCTDIYETLNHAVGTPTDSVLADIEAQGLCLDSHGDLNPVLSISYDCPDGEHTVIYNDFGHGVNGGLWQSPFPADFTYDDVMADCP